MLNQNVLAYITKVLADGDEILRAAESERNTDMYRAVERIYIQAKEAMAVWEMYR